MAKKSMIARDVKRSATVARDHAKRVALKAIIVNEELDFDERMAARDKLNSMDRNGARIRGKKRCSLTGRPRGVYSHFSLCRIKLREMASKGLLPGVTKSSW